VPGLQRPGNRLDTGGGFVAWGLKTPTFRLLRRVWDIGYRRVFEEGVGYRIIVCRNGGYEDIG